MAVRNTTALTGVVNVAAGYVLRLAMQRRRRSHAATFGV
jgi:hypothetical protein